jgi:hypothetical protein
MKYQTIKGVAEQKHLLEVKTVENGISKTQQIGLKDVQLAVIVGNERKTQSLEKFIKDLNDQIQQTNELLEKTKLELKEMIKVIADRVDLIKTTLIEEGEIV